MQSDNVEDIYHIIRVGILNDEILERLIQRGYFERKSDGEK